MGEIKRQESEDRREDRREEMMEHPDGLLRMDTFSYRGKKI